MMAGLRKDVEALLLAHGKDAVWTHSQDVAREAVRLAARFGVDAEACEVAGLCHDVGCVLTPADMTARAKAEGWWLDPAEERYPFLLHQRFSEVLCRERLAIDDEWVLSAVGCHTTLKRGASALDIAVYLADKLAWDQEGVPPYREVVDAALETGLAAGCLAQIEYVMGHGMVLMPHRWLLEARDWLHAGGM